MKVFCDFETVCVNCKEKGYSFGFSLKTVEYHGTTVLDLPQRYLNGPSISFGYHTLPILLRSIENSHAHGITGEMPNFAMINAKHDPSGELSRFTYRYLPHLHPDLQAKQNIKSEDAASILEYVDQYRFQDKPYLLFFYTFRNNTPYPLDNFDFFQLYDFDVYGASAADSDLGGYNSELGVIYQYDATRPALSSIHAGIGSIQGQKPDFFAANLPERLVSIPGRGDLDNFLLQAPADVAVALEWKISRIEPKGVHSFPIFMAFGDNKDDFMANARVAQKHLSKLMPLAAKGVDNKVRQEIDPSLKRMSFSRRQWCKN